MSMDSEHDFPFNLKKVGGIPSANASSIAGLKNNRTVLQEMNPKLRPTRQAKTSHPHLLLGNKSKILQNHLETLKNQNEEVYTEQSLSHAPSRTMKENQNNPSLESASHEFDSHCSRLSEARYAEERQISTAENDFGSLRQELEDFRAKLLEINRHANKFQEEILGSVRKFESLLIGTLEKSHEEYQCLWRKFEDLDKRNKKLGENLNTADSPK